MHKKRLLALLLAAALGLSLLTGCGGKKSSSDSSAGGNGQSSEETAGNVLSTDGDTFQVLMLDRMMQTPDTGVVEMLGEGDDQTWDESGELATRVYSGVLFGQDVRYTVSYELDDVCKIVVDFSTAMNEDDVAATISKQLEIERKDDGTWHGDCSQISITANNGNTEIVLEPYTGN